MLRQSASACAAGGCQRIETAEPLADLESCTVFPPLIYPGSGGFLLALAWASLNG